MLKTVTHHKGRGFSEQNQMSTEVILFIAGGVFTVLFFLLRQKDAAQAEQIRDLYQKHEDDSSRLIALELKLAHEYHSKTDIRDVLENLKLFFNERFDRMEEALGIERRKNGMRHD
jgi:dihydroorotase-like cyclic amidohydrolase